MILPNADGTVFSDRPCKTKQPTNESIPEKRTAGEAGWRYSRYNLTAPAPGKEGFVIIANLFRGTCAEYNPLELYLFSIMERLDEHHPAIGRFAERGIIVRFDERKALEAMGRAACAGPFGVSLTICPTMNCNFDCPYCFEDHRPGKMSPEVQDDVVNLARRMLEAGGRKTPECHLVRRGAAAGARRNRNPFRAADRPGGCVSRRLFR